MGGSSAPSAAPTSSTVVNTNIPDYAQPYVMNMLQAAQSQIFQPDGTTFNAYQPYSNNPANYVAGFSPLQQQAQSSAANLQMPANYGMGSGLAAYGTGQALTAGQGLQNTLTNPGAISQYMNPYLQNTLQPAMQLLNQQYGQQAAQEQGAATRQGAFGGSREALMAGLNQQNQMLAQNQLVGNAYNQAYNNAQTQAQNVANLNLQGAQAGITGANTLAGIGGQQLQAQQGIIGTQAQQGLTEQQQQQQIINQAVQNYATAQQYPFMQLGVLNAMLRGLPLQQSTTQMYQAAPSTAQSAIGLLGAGSALAGAVKGSKKGGRVKEMASGGIANVPGYKYGTLINDEQLQADAQGLSPMQMQQRIQDPQVNPSERQTLQNVQADQNRLRQIPGAGQAIAQAGLPPVAQNNMMSAPPQMNQAIPMDARLSGIAQAGGPAFATMGSPTRMAAGGITYFEEGGSAQDRRNAAIKAVDTALPEPTTLPADYKGNMSQYLADPTTQQQIQNRQIAMEAVKRNNPVYGSNVMPQPAPMGSAFSAPPAAAPVIPAAPAAPAVAEKPAPGTEILKTEKDAVKAAAAAQAKAAVAAQNQQTQQIKNQATQEPSLLDMFKQRQELEEQAGIKPGVGDRSKAAMDILQRQQAGLADKADFNKRLAIAQGFLDFAQRPALGKGLAGMLAPAAHAVGVGATSYAAARDSADAAEMANAKAQADLEASDRKFAKGDIDGAVKSYEDYQRNKTQLQVANITAQAHLAGAGASQKLHEAAIQDYLLAHPGAQRWEAQQAVSGLGRADANDITATKALLTDASNRYLTASAKDKPAIQAEINLYKQKLAALGGVDLPGAKTTATSGLPPVHKTEDGKTLYLHKDGLYYTSKES